MLDAQLAQLKKLIEYHTPSNGLHETAIQPLLTFKDNVAQGRVPCIYEPALLIAAQGQKNIYLDGKRYYYCAGHFMALFMPMAVECEVIGVSEAEPIVGLAIRLDRHRLAKLLLKIDEADANKTTIDDSENSGIFSSKIKSNMLTAVIRLLEVLKDPIETAVLGNGIIDEIYFRLLSEEQGGALRVHLRQQGQIQQISKAVEHLHDNLDKNVSIDELANLSNMSSSGFHKKFKEVMHVSPLQYTKSIRLNKAKMLILEGKNVSEAGYIVGYNSAAQFSREFKRQFGMSPSDAAY